MNKINGLNEVRFIIERGYIYWAVLPDIGGSVQRGNRPVIIIQNDKGNENSPNVTVVPITSRGKKWLPTHVDLTQDYIVGLPKNSIALCESPMTIPKTALGDYIDLVEESTLEKINDALKIQMNLGETSRISNIKEKAKEFAKNIEHYQKTIDELSEYLPKLIVEQTRIKITIETRNLEQYCLRNRLNMSEFVKEEVNNMGYSYIDKNVIAL